MNYKECAYFSLYKQSPWIYKNYTFEISSSIRQQISRHPFAIHVVPRTQTNEHIEHTHTHEAEALQQDTGRSSSSKEARRRTLDDREDDDEQQSHDTYANGFHIMHK